MTEKKLTARHLRADVVHAIGKLTNYKAGAEVPGKDVIEAVLANKGINRDTHERGSSTRTDKKPYIVLQIEWAFRNQRDKYIGKNREATCVQGVKKGMWALTEAGLKWALELSGNPAAPETTEESAGSSEPEQEDEEEPEPQGPQNRWGYSEEEIRRGARAVVRHWHYLVDKANLEKSMRPPTFELSFGRNWGYWNAEKRILSINARLAVKFRNSYDFHDTVAHELAHQWVSEVAENVNEPPHGPTWKSACKLFGANPKATAKDRLDELCADPDKMDQRVLRKVKKLLSLAGSSNANEAELAAFRAQEILCNHQMSLADVGGEALWNYTVLGEPMRQRPQWMLHLSAILRDFYHVQTIWLPVYSMEVPDEIQQKVKPAKPRKPRGTTRRRRPRRPIVPTVLEITGTPANVAIAEHVYQFLLKEGERRLQEHRDNGGGTGRATRIDFLEGLYLGFHAKLAQQNKTLTESLGEKGTALVLQTDKKLREFYRSRHPRIVSFGGGSDRLSGDEDARSEGRRQGKLLSIRESVTEERGLALPG